MGKRLLDLALALPGLVLCLPLFVVLAIAIKLDSRGPVFYTQVRVGRQGRPFRLYKFRSMLAGSDAGAAITANTDARVTRVGRVIRLLRIDELPQLLNVIKGDMSLVGPRPEAPSVVERYSEEQREILEARPGITGPTQLAWIDESDAFPPGTDPTDYYVRYVLPLKLESDLRYVRTRTLARDAGYLVLTPLRLAQLALARPGFGRVLKLGRLLTDVGAVILGTVLASYARFDGHIPLSFLGPLVAGLPLTAGAYAAAFVGLKTYRGIWRFAGVEDVWQLVKACALGGVISAAALRLVAIEYPRTVIVLSPVLIMLLMAGARLAWRTAVTALGSRRWAARGRRVVIVGAGRTGEGVVRDILNSPGLGYVVVGFVDDDPDLRGSMLHNLPVLGTTDQLPELARQHRLDEAIISIPRLSLRELRRIGEACARAGLEFKTVPSIAQLVRGEGRLRYLRSVNQSELLRREAVSFSPEKVRAFLAGKRVMVTGAGGSVGSELCRQVAGLGADALLMVDRAENGLFEIGTELQAQRVRTRLSAALADVKHVARMGELLDSFKPHLVFHAAAYKHVPLLESHPTEAVLNNVVGTVRLAHLAQDHGVETFVFISTDKAARPGNLMGATKRVCELYLTALNRQQAAGNGPPGRPQFRLVRFGNVLGSAGSALPLFQRQIESGSPITITSPEASRFFMTIQEAVALLLESATLDVEGDITVLDMGEPVRIARLADDLVTAMGLPGSMVPRRVIGLRPGEKLHEVLWEETDQVIPSSHPRIVSVRHHGRSLDEMISFVRDLERHALEGDAKRVLALLGEMVPTYQPRWDNGPAAVVHLEAGEPAQAECPPLGTLRPAPPTLKPAVNEAP